jgi:hypothetical protein
MCTLSPTHNPNARTHTYYHEVCLYSQKNYFQIEKYADLIGLGRRLVGWYVSKD